MMRLYTVVDYVWIGGNGELRSKTRVVPNVINSLQDVPEWNYDGSSTSQAYGRNSEITLIPRNIYKCPFRRPDGLIVICDTYNADGTPAIKNHRYQAARIFERYRDHQPWYGLEQEYFIYDMATGRPLGYDVNGRQGQYYCGVGALNAFGRDVSDQHLEACLYAGIRVSGTNAEVAPGQFEFQIGPVEGIDAADQLWVARYILEKISEKMGVYIVYHPKPLDGDWNGSGCHTNFSTAAMRQVGGYDVVLDAIDKLSRRHDEHMQVYGDDNHLRMSGVHETSDYRVFTWGVGDRSASIRVPTETARVGYGYFEDRRPASNMDPYLVTSIIMNTVADQ